MLPEGFQWVERWQYANGELALKLCDSTVATLMQNNDGRWYARLECHWPITAPLVSRDCSSRDTGNAGIQLWACRNEARLRAELAGQPGTERSAL